MRANNVRSATIEMAGEEEALTATSPTSAAVSERQQQIRELVRYLRHHHMDYETFRQISAAARKAVSLRRPSRSRRLPQILPDASLRRLYETISAAGNHEHEIMLKLLLYTAVRVSELVNIQIADVDLDACKIFIRQGKGDKDRYILFPAAFTLVLRMHIGTITRLHQRREYLFESTQRRPYSTRRIEQILKEYARKAEVPHVHPHMLRHQMLTWLGRQGVPDAQLQLISGHTNRKSLEIYQHLTLEGVAGMYQEAVGKLKL